MEKRRGKRIKEKWMEARTWNMENERFINSSVREFSIFFLIQIWYYFFLEK